MKSNAMSVNKSVGVCYWHMSITRISHDNSGSQMWLHIDILSEFFVTTDAWVPAQEITI